MYNMHIESTFCVHTSFKFHFWVREMSVIVSCPDFRSLNIHVEYIENVVVIFSLNMTCIYTTVYFLFSLLYSSNMCNSIVLFTQGVIR